MASTCMELLEQDELKEALWPKSHKIVLTASSNRFLAPNYTKLSFHVLLHRYMVWMIHSFFKPSGKKIAFRTSLDVQLETAPRKALQKRLSFVVVVFLPSIKKYMSLSLQFEINLYQVHTRIKSTH